jgi:hypothetical protein
MLLDSVLVNIDSILDNLKASKLNAYKLTQDQLYKVDVSTDPEYQKTYTKFYVLRLPNTEAYKGHFSVLEKFKHKQAIQFSAILDELKIATGRIEASFSSKILATINPNVAPLDKLVLGHLNLSLPKPYEANRLSKCASVHEQLVIKMGALVENGKFITIKKLFEKRYPMYNFSNTKILDLLLWQYRP